MASDRFRFPFNGGPSPTSGYRALTSKSSLQILEDYIFRSGSVSLSVIAESSTYQISGVAATLRTSRLIGATSGSYVISGQAANLVYAPAAKVIAATNGIYSISGQSTTNLKVGHLVGATSGSYVISGQIANLKHSDLIGAGAGSYVISGQAANLKRAYTLSAVGNSYVLNGQIAALTLSSGPRIITAVNGSYNISGQPTTNLKTGRIISATNNSYLLIGQPTTNLKTTRIIAALSDTYNIAGQSATLVYGQLQKIIVAGIGVYNLVGSIANLIKSESQNTVDGHDGGGSYPSAFATPSKSKRSWENNEEIEQQIKNLVKEANVVRSRERKLNAEKLIDNAENTSLELIKKIPGQLYDLMIELRNMVLLKEEEEAIVTLLIS